MRPAGQLRRLFPVGPQSRRPDEFTGRIIMNESENTALVQQAYALFGRGDIPGLLRLMSPDVVWEIMEVENVPFTGTFEGLGGLQRFFSTLAGTVDILKFEPQEFIAQRDKVVVLGESLFRTKDSGKEFGNKWAHVTTVANGKLKHFQDYGDTAAAEKAFKK
jgi:uncharacterized protein